MYSPVITTGVKDQEIRKGLGTGAHTPPGTDLEELGSGWGGRRLGGPSLLPTTVSN